MRTFKLGAVGHLTVLWLSAPQLSVHCSPDPLVSLIVPEYTRQFPIWRPSHLMSADAWEVFPVFRILYVQAPTLPSLSLPSLSSCVICFWSSLSIIWTPLQKSPALFFLFSMFVYISVFCNISGINVSYKRRRETSEKHNQFPFSCRRNFCLLS